MNVLAYHITWGTYGTRLHGDPRGTVDRQHNEFGTPVLGYDEHRWEREKENLNFDPVVFTRDEMRLVESLIPGICERGHWIYRTCAAGPDHVHVILASEHNPETIRRLLKRWLSQELSSRKPLPDGAVWWAECGSIKWIDSERYLKNATKYVTDQRATPAQ
jgi:hypothetical protein